MSKSSSTRYLKNYLSDRYEILYAHSNRHGVEVFIGVSDDEGGCKW